MKDSAKIKITERNILKVLDVLSCCKAGADDAIIVTEDFYSKFPRMEKPKVNQTINAMEARGIIEVQRNFNNEISITLTSKAFSYKLDKRCHTREVTIPIIISIIALIKSFLPEIIWLMQQLMQLVKKP